MNCQNCGAPLQLTLDKGHYECQYCGAIYFPREVREGMISLGNNTDLECKLCHFPLAMAWVDRYQLLFCEKCKGKLIPSAVFEHLIDFLRASSDKPAVIPPLMNPEELKRKIECPKCHQWMDTHPYGGHGNIIIDNCPRCALNWLDHHELMKIVYAPNRRISPKY